MVVDNFSRDLKSFHTAPFLFVGSGFSRRYLKTEDWKNLLKRFSDKINQFDYYFSKADGNLPLVAELMAKDFMELWWKDSLFEKSRENYSEFGEMISPSSPLKYEISQYILEQTDNYLVSELSRELNDLRNIVVDGIITTNWDLLLEKLFVDYKVYISQDELISANLQEIGEIYKIHGSVSDFNSLILTDSDYKSFNQKNPYLVSKLLTIFIEHPIIFIGYSLNDENIRAILKSIAFCLSDSGLSKIKNNIFIVEPIFDGKEDIYEKTFINIDTYSLPIVRIRVKDYSDVYIPMAGIERKLSVKQLREIKAAIYELVRTNDPKSKLCCIGINDETDISKVDFVIGVGIENQISSLGYTTYDYLDIVHDVVLDNLNVDYDCIVQKTLPHCLKAYPRTPIYKYLYNGGYLKKSTTKEIPYSIKKHMDKIPNSDLKQYGVTKLIATYKGCRKKLEYNYQLNSSTLLKACISENGKESIDLEKLHQLLIDNIDNRSTAAATSNFNTVTRIYDWLRYNIVD